MCLILKMEDSFVFAGVLSEDEWQSVPEEVGKKIVKFVNENFDSLIKTKALLETKSYNLEKSVSDAALEVEKSKLECQSLKAKLDLAANTINEHELQLSKLTAEVNKLHTQCNTFEAEASEYRHQRNQAVDEKDEHLRMINRRNGEIERLQSDLNSLTKQLETAINAKCEALAQIDEVASLKLNIEYREKRIEQERTLLSSQVDSLTQEVNQRTEELLDMRRDNTSLCIQLETKLSQKTQELTVATEQIKSLTDLNTNLTTRIDELSQKMANQREVDAKMNESYVNEIEAKTKMANSYKSMYEEMEQHADELKEALTEVQQLLKTATDQYGELETKNKEAELANEEIILKKNECIELLKKELETANELIENSKPGLNGEGLLSPSASTSKMSKVGMSYSELYSRYVTVSDKLSNKEEECARLENYIETIIREMEGNFPKLRKLHEDYSDSLNAIDTLKESNELLLNEVQQLRDANADCKKGEGIQSRENERLKKEVSDLSRQVVVLLQEVENSRVGSSSTSTDNDLSDSVNSADIISKKLVTFNDISELQANNLKLLVLVRELSERQEEVESLDPAAIAALKNKLDDLSQSQNELLEERDKQIKMMATLRNQKDMYKNLYMQVVKTTGEDVNVMDTSDNGEPRIRTETESQLEEKIKEFEAQVKKLTQQVDHLKEENETYRKEKTANEKILLEQLENMRSEVKEITRLNCKLSSHADLNEEKFKVLHNNIEIYKKQITALEKQNKIYSESIIKHEQAATYLKNETLQSQTKLSRAEVMLGNLEKENALLKDAEQRLLKEREALKRNSHEQHLIKSNIELIKATLERTDAEGKLRLESRLDEAHRECAALRRRLQEEQDHFRSLADQLSVSNKNIQTRMEEEREIAEKFRKEVAEVREELKVKVSQNEELSKKLKSGMFSVPDSSAETRKVRELEQQQADLQAEIESLKKKLKTAKEASDEYFNIAEASEKQAKEAIDNNELLLQEADKYKSRIKELEEKCSELEGELSIQLDDQDISNASIKGKSTQLQEELNIRNMDLRTAKEQLENARSENKQLIEQLKASENKYAREVTLHSVDLEALTTMKEDLNKALDELNVIQVEKQNAITSLNQSKTDWETREKLFINEKQELEARFADMDAQNSLLHDQIQALNTQLATLQALVTEPQNTSIGDASFNRSFTEDEMKSSEQLLKIIKYLRQEKDIAVSKADIVEAEHSRLKSQFEMMNKELEEARAAIETERQKTEISVISSAKHAEVLRKLETLNAITDSNRSLRQERDTLVAQITELRSKSDRFETEVEPLQEKNRELTTKADQLQSENISLRAECTRWRQRANMLIEKTNRTSPEDWKKLQTERETLAKQLTIERANVTKLNDDVNNFKQDKIKLEEQLKNLRSQNNQQQEEISRLREDVSSLQAQVTQLTSTVDQQSAEIIKFREENRVLTEDTAGKDVTISDLKNNLAQIRKIAKKYKIQYEEQTKELETVKQQNQQYKTDQTSSVDRQTILENQCSELEEKVSQLEANHKEQVENMNREISSTTDQIDHFKKEIETLKQTSQDKEERFKTLFKNAKERIVSLTEQNNSLKEEVRRQDSSSKTDSGEQSNQDSTKIAEYLEKIAALERERDDILEEKQQEQEKHTTEVENLSQRISQLQRQLGLQQGSKPSTSSSTTEKSSTERPTADIKPMAGHSTNTQTQSVPIQPWRSGGEPPLASIRPMSAQLRTVAVLPTSQSPSAIMVPPQQQVHTTGSSSIEALSSSPTSSHTEYVPATSSATPAMLAPRQVVVPPTQSSQDTEDDENSVQVQAAPQAQAVALVLPRVEPPSSGPTQEQGTSSSSSNTVTTTQAGHKRQREADMDSCQSDDPNKTQQQTKRTRVQQAGTVSDSCLDVEYQVPTSSQRDHDDDNVIVVESDEEGGADEGEGADDEQDDPDTEGYDMEGMEQGNYEDEDCQDVEDDEEEGGNEVEVIDDSSEVPNQSERSEQNNEEEENPEQPQSEAISSGTDGSNTSYNATISQVSTSVSMTVPSFSRTRPIAPLPSRQNHLLLQHGIDEVGDDGIVPSTPTLYVPRRSDGFGEAVSSPHVPTSGRFTFNDQTPSNAGSNNIETLPEQTLMESNILEENSTGRSVPTTPLQSSPQEGLPGNEEQNAAQVAESDAEIPTINVSGEVDNNEMAGEGSSADMGPPAEGAAQLEQNEAMLEGDDGVSSEGEKPPVAEEGEEEGREAEASPSTNSRGLARGTNSARRSMRSSMPRGNQQSRGNPIPIVWGERSPQRHQHNQDRSRGSPSGNFQSRAVARRARGRNQRPFGGHY